MERKSLRLITALGVWLAALILAAPVSGATFGEAVAIGGHASDLALDEARGVLYIANFTANRIDVMSLADHRIQTSMNVSAQPSSLAMSPDGRYLVVTHFGNFKDPAAQNNALTVIDLQTRARRTMALGAPGLAVAFGKSPKALVVTDKDFLLFDPVSGTLSQLSSIKDLTATSLPVAPANFPPNIITTSMNVSGDGMKIYGLTDTFEFGYDVRSGWLRILGYTSTPAQAPRAVSVDHNGGRYLAGWVLHGGNIWNTATGVWSLAEFPHPSGLLNVGSHAIDSSRGRVYAQFIEAGKENANLAPTLLVMRADNLAVLEKLQMPENLGGKSVLSSDSSTMYSVSDSGVMVLPIGKLGSSPRVVSSKRQLLFASNFCDQSVQTKEFILYDRSGGQTSFTLAATGTGVNVTPQSGVTPATITVRADPAAMASAGTSEATITVKAPDAINIPETVRVLLNKPNPDQRGTIVSVAGKLVDVVADPRRDRFYVLRQDTNEVLVFSANDYRQIASVPTGNQPTQMTMVPSQPLLLVGHDASQYVEVINLDTLQPERPIITPPGHYPRSVAVSGNAILTANRVAGPKNTIDRADLATRQATELPTLGIYDNDINVSTVLVASSNGSSILAAMADGNVMLYDASADTFTVSRKDANKLEGAYAASSFGQFVAGDRFMNASLVTTAILPATAGVPSGFAFVGRDGFRTEALDPAAPGTISRVSSASGQDSFTTRTAEAPLVGNPDFPFTRTLAVMEARKILISLSRSGFTVLPWSFDASVATPKVHDVVNAADYKAPVAPGGLISLFGDNLSPTNQASSQIPLPTALGDSCLTVNGIPTPILYVSPKQVNAQLPFSAIGNTTLVFRTPGGVSDSFRLTIDQNAPAVFERTTPSEVLVTVIRAANNQVVSKANPIHTEEHIIIYLTGMGRTTPTVKEGQPAPADPPALVINQPKLQILDAPVPVSFAGLAPGQVGVYQINAQVPWWTKTGEAQPLVITQGGASTTVRVPIVN